MIQVKKTSEKATFEKAHTSDTGFDLTCVDIVRKNFGLFMLDLGVQVAPPQLHFFMLLPRSSFCKSGWTMANNAGIIDNGYRGNWFLPVRRISTYDPEMVFNEDGRQDMLESIAKECEELFLGKRIAQAVLQQNHSFHQELIFTDSLDTTIRGDKGFGSSGE